MISIICECGKKYKVKEKYAGKKIACVDCEKIIRIPKQSDNLPIEVASENKTNVPVQIKIDLPKNQAEQIGGTEEQLKAEVKEAVGNVKESIQKLFRKENWDRFTRVIKRKVNKIGDNETGTKFKNWAIEKKEKIDFSNKKSIKLNLNHKISIAIVFAVLFIFVIWLSGDNGLQGEYYLSGNKDAKLIITEDLIQLKNPMQGASLTFGYKIAKTKESIYTISINGEQKYMDIKKFNKGIIFKNAFMLRGNWVHEGETLSEKENQEIEKAKQEGFKIKFLRKPNSNDTSSLTRGKEIYRISNIVSVGENIFFNGYTRENGYEIWKSDGTLAGTNIVKDVNSEKDHFSPKNLTNVNGTLFFSADDGIHNFELWKSDGTTNGTVLVKDINPGIATAECDNFVPVENHLFFIANNGDGKGLWISDGSKNGTKLLRKGVRKISYATKYKNSYILCLESAQRSGESYLWKSDGTPTETQQLYNSGYTNNRRGKKIQAKQAIEVVSSIHRTSNTLFFLGREYFFETHDPNKAINQYNLNNHLWYIDLDSQKVNRLTDSSFRESRVFFSAISNKILFANTDYEGELWETDGTAPGTKIVKYINPEKSGSNINHLTAMNNRIFFTANDGYRGQELWKSDGTLEGTDIVKDIEKGRASSSPNSLVVVGNYLYFLTGDGYIWKSDGSKEGTVKVGDKKAEALCSSNQKLFAVKEADLFLVE